MRSWEDLLDDEREGEPIIACSRTDEEMAVKFDADGFLTAGCTFTAWSERRVFFPGDNDGSEFVASAPRNPCEEHTKHVGTWS